MATSGPLSPKSDIREFFSEGEERERALDKLYKADRDDNLTKQHKKLLRRCHDLLKYALPEYVLLQSVYRFLSSVNRQTHNRNATCYLQDSCYYNPSISWDQASIPSSKGLSRGITASCFRLQKPLESTSPGVWRGMDFLPGFRCLLPD